MKKIICLLLICCLVQVVSADYPDFSDDTFEPQTTIISIYPDNINAEVGENITITIDIKPSTEIDTVALDGLSWNPEVIQCLEIEKGDLFEDSTIWIANKGEGEYTALCWGSTISTDEEGTFATLKFKVLKEEPTEVKLDIKKVGVARAGTDIEKDFDKSKVSINAKSTPNNNGVVVGDEFNLFLPIIAFVCGAIIIVAFLVRRQKRKEKNEKITNDDIEDIFK